MLISDLPLTHLAMENLTVGTAPLSFNSQQYLAKSVLAKTDLAKYCWELKDKGAVPTVKFSIAKCVKGKSLINNCSLCLSEKLFIIRSLDDVNMLNKKSEFISKCRHINKRLLIKVKDDSND